MKIDLTVDNGPCNSDLRTWCLGIAIYSLINIILSTVFGPSVISFIMLVIAIIANVCLLYGSLRSNHMLVGVWLIYAIILAINFPFSILGTIFHFGSYRESTGFHSVFPALLVYIIFFIILLFCARIVYSFYLQLKNSQSTPQSAVVV